jgi:hypothetical protein
MVSSKPLNGDESVSQSDGLSLAKNMNLFGIADMNQGCWYISLIS